MCVYVCVRACACVCVRESLDINISTCESLDVFSLQEWAGQVEIAAMSLMYK